jgi:mannitol-1-/sugar-/sorbitol-6-phosphatase
MAQGTGLRKLIQVTCKALLFDMDGVLIDSTPAVARVWRQWAIAHGFEPESTIRMAHGRPSIATLRDLLPNADHEAENREVERREIEDTEGVVALPGSRELLSKLPNDRWAVVTSATRPLAETRLRVAGLPIPKFFVTSNDIVKGKPDPEPYIKGAALLGLSPMECVVVEDVPAGIRSGKGAGARVIAFTTTVAPGELRAAGADWILPNCGAIKTSEADEGLSLLLRLNRLVCRRRLRRWLRRAEIHVRSLSRTFVSFEVCVIASESAHAGNNVVREQ